ncbi:MAG: LexA family transcriptional regulator [Muribaculaceae bacterium]|nr:LexA family transcriptional regulator [Muribaculaceae bacterium]
MNQEIKEIVNRIKYLHNTTQQGVAELAGVNPRYLSSVINGRYPLSDELKMKLNELCLYNNKESEQTEEKSDGGIPYFEQENFECGSPSGFGGMLEANNPDGYFAFPWIKPDGQTWCVRAHGNSMVNRSDPMHSICHGAWVAMRKANIRAIQWGEVYALATADGYIIKKIMPSDNEGMIRCVSFNEEDGYMPFELSVNEIYDYAMIVGVANINLW